MNRETCNRLAELFERHTFSADEMAFLLRMGCGLDSPTRDKHPCEGAADDVLAQLLALAPSSRRRVVDAVNAARPEPSGTSPEVPKGYFLDFRPEDPDDPEGDGEWVWGTLNGSVPDVELGTAETRDEALAALREHIADADSVERLDRSKPPLGYHVELIDGEWWWGLDYIDIDGTSYLDRDDALAAAWAYFEVRSDPPGRRWSTFDRATAWAWYWRRLGVLRRFAGRPLADIPAAARSPWQLWPGALTWPDDQVAEVERWLVDSTVEMPEVLRAD